ncbi:hypothetical protein HUA74_07145 [Myxococcus sp. CA051A]|uniref:hypothetical protein n=1 Tax=Myxococcus sp. CA051A TaxID=2741739 RepID=UPI00157B4F84|nr:hypothetical protein [Myxococcus sp. CA051A]NTX51652.1 hypothetical protein [Myxococcus sp. CA039A]NTX60433.1 hypothetical protein [Myxococcus sp. CA051A]
MKNPLAWLVGMAALVLTVGCGPMEPDETLDTPSEDSAQTGEVSAAATKTCREKCSDNLSSCNGRCGGNLGCVAGCSAVYSICISGC